jgi:hypothetical protein
MPLFRFFSVSTPSSTDTPIRIQDSQGNYYSAYDFTCMVVGFQNNPGDRTYNCFCFFDNARNWYVQYDQAGGGGVVNILAISNALFVGGTD